MRKHPDGGVIAAFFDLDLTITSVDTFRLFLKEYYASTPFRIHYLLYILLFGVLRKLRLVSLKEFKQRALIGLRKKTRSQIRLLGIELFESHMLGRIRPKAISKIEMHKKNGDLVFIVSASPDIYLHAFCEYLNCDGYFCTELEYVDEVFTGNIDGNDCIGEEKSSRVDRVVTSLRLQKSNTFAYTDHHIDLPLLESVGNPHAISPTARLKELAYIRNWTVSYW